VWPSFYAACDRRIDSEVLLHRTPARILDRGAPLDDASDRGGPPIDRLLEGISHERARCLRGASVGKTPYRRSISGTRVLNAKFRADPGRQTHMRVVEHHEGRVRGSSSRERTEIAALNNGIWLMWIK
jgi:hypothetical protein